MPGPEMFYNILQTDLENLISIQASPKPKVEMVPPSSHLTTSEKIRYLLTKFPSAQPARPNVMIAPNFGPPFDVCRDCISTNCKMNQQPVSSIHSNTLETKTGRLLDGISDPGSARKGRSWGMVGELARLMQLAVAATALILYYLIYGWMQLLYTGVKVAVFFRRADGPMKITLGVVAVTSLIVGFNLLLRIKKLYAEIVR